MAALSGTWAVGEGGQPIQWDEEGQGLRAAPF